MRLSRTWPFPPLSAKPSYALLSPPFFRRPHAHPQPPRYVLRMLQSRLKKLATTSQVLAAAWTIHPPALWPTSAAVHHGGPLSIPASTSPSRRTARPAPCYVPNDLLPEVRTWLAEHKRLKTLLHEIHQLSVALLRDRARLLKLKAGRP